MIPLPAKTLHDAAEQLMGLFVETGLAESAAPLLERVGETPAREAITVENDVFIIHFRTDAVAGLGAALGVTADPIALESDSKRTARVVVAILGPYKESPRLLQSTSAFYRTLNQGDVASRLTRAVSVDEVLAIANLMDVELPGYLTVSDLMIPRPRSVWPDATIEDAARVMTTNRISAIPVTSEQGAVLGMVTYRDLLRAGLPEYIKRVTGAEPEVGEESNGLESTDPRHVMVREVMDRSVLCVSEDQTLADVANVLVGKGVDRIPVVRDGVLVGLLTRGEIVRRLFGP